MINVQSKRTLEHISQILETPISFNLQRQPSKKYALAVKDQDEEPKLFFLTKNKYTVGRDASNNIRIMSAGVSRYHATLHRSQDLFWITDGVIKGKLSTNGIAINHKKCYSRKLRDGDLITFSNDACALLVEIRNNELNTVSIEDTFQKLQSFCKGNEDFQEAPADTRVFLRMLPELMLQVDSNGTILKVKESSDSIFSRYNQELINESIFKCFPAEVSRRVISSIDNIDNSRCLKNFDCKIETDEGKVPCEVQITVDEEQAIFVIFRNISGRKKLENRLRHDALHDPLTKLPNRSFFANRIEFLIQHEKIHKDCHFAVLLLDLDHFKVINDSLGHPIGDQLIVRISKRIKDCLRPKDFMARLGGDEFAIILEQIEDVNEAVNIAKRIQVKLSNPLMLNHYELLPSASIGITHSNFNYENVNEILRDADIAMYQAKSSGRSRFEVFDQAMHQKALASLRLDSDLKNAIKNQEFKLVYQPIICLKTQKLIGFEALIRWLHPERGLVSPEEFIRQAEESGLIIAIGEWALEAACRQLQTWNQMSGTDIPLAMTVNVSSKQFSSPHLIPHITDLLHKYQLDPNWLKLEITESIIMENSKFSADIFNQIRNLGLQICIDDFGTGYSSLSYLHRFPIDALKIDRSFILEMDNSPDNTGFAIAQAVIGLAHNLGLKVIAEGVESARHLVWLRSFKCDFGQGYFFSRPLEEEKATLLVQKKGNWWQRDNSSDSSSNNSL